MDLPEGGSTITLQPVEVLTGPDDHEGVLVFVDGRLAAVLVRLDGDYHGDPAGAWNLDVGFGPCEARPAPFGTIAKAVAWVRKRVDDRDLRRHGDLGRLAGGPAAG